MKTLIFIEQPEDYLAAQKFLGKYSLQSSPNSSEQEFLVVNLNSSRRFEFPGWPGNGLRSEDDYLEKMNLEPLNHQALKDTRFWLEHPKVAGMLDFHGVNLGLVVEHSLVRAVTTVYKFIELIRFIIDSENPDKIVVFVSPAKKQKDIRFTEHDKLADSVLHVLALSLEGQRRLEIQRVDLEAGRKIFSDKPVRRKDYPVLRFLSQYARRFLNGGVRFANPVRKDILICGHPGKTFPIIEEILKNKGNRMFYFQKQTAPRLLFWLFRHGIPYWTLEDFFCEESENPSSERKSSAFASLLHGNQLFVYKGMDLTPVFKEKFDFLFARLIPTLQADISKFRILLQKTGCRLIVIDEDIHYFARSLVLAAKSFGVKSAEFQHGAVTKYFLQCEVADKKLVWGNYFKNRILQDTDIPASNISIVGPIHLERLAREYQNGRSGKDSQEIRRLLKIQSGAKIILFTPHAFHKSSKGGALNHHNTRSIAEATLREVLRAVQEQAGVHLIIKLHHADDKPHFYHEFIAAEKYKIMYSIVQFVSIYRLMSACDVLITPVSTTIFEAMVLERPVILTNYEKRKLPFARVEQAVECVSEEGALAVLLPKILENPAEFLNRVEAGRRTVKEEYLCGNDGLSGRRLTEEILGLLKGSDLPDQ